MINEILYAFSIYISFIIAPWAEVNSATRAALFPNAGKESSRCPLDGALYYYLKLLTIFSKQTNVLKVICTNN
jgi:hypothetical protein